MIRGVLAFGLALLCCAGARAQQQSSILGLIIQYESSGNPTAQSTTTSASGLFQDVNGTWASALSLCDDCGTTAQYPTAASAPASVQIAANAALINDHGLSDWMCANCDPALVAAINQMGGISAFQTSGYSTNPADYASADTPAGLQTFMTNMTVTTNGDLTTGSGTATVRTIPTAGALSRPFQWSWDHIMVQGQQNVAEITGKVQQIAWAPWAAIVVIWGFVRGTKFWAGTISWGSVAMDIFALGIVGSLVAPGGANWYGQFAQAMEGLPAYFASNIGNANAGTGPAAVFDSVWQSFLIKVIEAWGSSPWEKLALTALILFFVILDIVIALGSMFFAYLAGNFIIYIFLSVGPVFILGYLFQHTYVFFRWWLDLTVGLLAFILILNVVLNFFGAVLAQLIDANGPGISAGTQWTYWIPNLLGSVIVLNVLAAVIGFVTLNVGRIHSGISRIGRV